MKKGFVLLVFMLLAIFGFTQKFDGGIFLGPVVSQVDGDNYGGYNKVGGIVGAWVSRDFGNNWSGQFEIEWVHKGSRKLSRPSAGDYSVYYMKLAYIDFPIMATYSLHQKIKMRFGLIPAYLISYQEGDLIGDFDSDITRPFKEVNLAAILGVNYQYNPKLSIELRQAMDIIPFRPHAGGLTTWYDYGQYNRWIEFAVLYSFKK